MKRLLVDTQNFSLTKAQINEAIATNGGRLIVEGVLQRAEAQNQNGRV